MARRPAKQWKPPVKKASTPSSFRVPPPSEAEQERTAWWARRIITTLAVGNGAAAVALASYTTGAEDVNSAILIGHPALSYFLSGAIIAVVVHLFQLLYAGLRVETYMSPEVSKRIKLLPKDHDERLASGAAGCLGMGAWVLALVGCIASAAFFYLGSYRIVMNLYGAGCSSAVRDIACASSPSWLFPIQTPLGESLIIPVVDEGQIRIGNEDRYAAVQFDRVGPSAGTLVPTVIIPSWLDERQGTVIASIHLDLTAVVDGQGHSCSVRVHQPYAVNGRRYVLAQPFRNIIALDSSNATVSFVEMQFLSLEATGFRLSYSDGSLRMTSGYNSPSDTENWISESSGRIVLFLMANDATRQECITVAEALDWEVARL